MTISVERVRAVLLQEVYITLRSVEVLVDLPAMGEKDHPRALARIRIVGPLRVVQHDRRGPAEPLVEVQRPRRQRRDVAAHLCPLPFPRADLTDGCRRNGCIDAAEPAADIGHHGCNLGVR